MSGSPLHRIIEAFSAAAFFCLLTPVSVGQDATTKVGYVLLNNQSVLKGTAIQRGHAVVIRYGDHQQGEGEIEVDRSRVLCWADSLKDLYQYRVDHRHADTLAVHLDDAKWCVQHGLFDVAVAELKRIRRIDPANEQALRIQKQLFYAVQAKQRALANQQADQRAIEAKENSDEHDSVAPPAVSLVAHEQDAHKQDARQQNDVALALAEVDPATLKTFVRSVQPILMNRCGSCHNSSSDLKWKLHLPTHGARPSALMTRENLVAVEKYISAEVPLESELRIRAMDGHAGRNALSINHSSATKTFDKWLTTARPSGAPLALAKQAYAKVDQSKPKAETMSAEHHQANVEQVGRLPEVENPFDPEIFNRRMHVTQKTSDSETK